MTILILLLFSNKGKNSSEELNKRNKGQNEILKIWRILNYLIFLQDYLIWLPITVQLETKLCLIMYVNNISFVLRK